MSAPTLIVLAGPNGAGKSTYFKIYLRSAGMLSVNADEITRRIDIPNPEAARAADGIRAELLRSKVSFITETVFSDPYGAKLQFLRDALAAGYEVRLIFIGLSSAVLSEARVIARVRAGGHDVPSERLSRRYEQSLKNLRAALEFVPDVTVFDNSSAADPFRLLLRQRNAKPMELAQPFPAWFASVMSQ